MERDAVNIDLIGIPGGARQLTSPALLIDLPKLRGNIDVMLQRCTDAGIRLRPHAKTHKSSIIALQQIERGAVGVCCATPHEAIAFALAKVPGLLVTAPVVQERHLQVLTRLHDEGADITVVLDSVEGVDRWHAALPENSRPLPTLVDLDLGMGRTGVRSPADAVALAKQLKESGRFVYRGIQAYSGLVQHVAAYEQRRELYLRQLNRLDSALAALSDAGLEPEIVTGGGTGTFAIDVERGLYTESQAGSYIFMDVEYNSVQLFRGESNPYQVSLVLRTSVISANVPGQVTLNAGFKALATDGPAPQPICGTEAGWQYEFFGDEYGLLRVGNEKLAVGDYVDLVTPHCDPTVNLHDYYHVIEGDTLVDIWGIDGRGVL